MKLSFGYNRHFQDSGSGTRRCASRIVVSAIFFLGGDGAFQDAQR